MGYVGTTVTGLAIWLVCVLVGTLFVKDGSMSYSHSIQIMLLSFILVNVWKD